jgi:hypothetical protein
MANRGPGTEYERQIWSVEELISRARVDPRPDIVRRCLNTAEAVSSVHEHDPAPNLRPRCKASGDTRLASEPDSASSARSRDCTQKPRIPVAPVIGSYGSGATSGRFLFEDARNEVGVNASTHGLQVG